MRPEGVKGLTVGGLLEVVAGRRNSRLPGATLLPQLDGAREGASSTKRQLIAKLLVESAGEAKTEMAAR